MEWLQRMNEALNVAIAQAFAKELDRAGLRGTGTNPEPRGILNTTGIKTVANGANGAALAGYGNFFSGVQELLGANAPMPTGPPSLCAVTVMASTPRSAKSSGR